MIRDVNSKHLGSLGSLGDSAVIGDFFMLFVATDRDIFNRAKRLILPKLRSAQFYLTRKFQCFSRRIGGGKTLLTFAFEALHRI